MLGKHLSEETKEKMRQAGIGKILSDETKEKIRIASTGRRPSAETLDKMRHREQCKPVAQMLNGEIIKTFDSVSEAKRTTGVRKISECALGKRNKAGGYQWAFV
jgi:hypothetical protein